MNEQYETDEEKFGEPNELEIGITDPYGPFNPKKKGKIVIYFETVQNNRGFV